MDNDNDNDVVVSGYHADKIVWFEYPNWNLHTISSYWKLQNSQQKPQINAYRILIDRPRTEIYSRIEQRVERMIEEGLLEEVESLLKRGYKPEDPGMRSVGYQELIPYFLDNEDLKTCIDLVKQHTRNYAKRQITWLKKYQFDLTLKQSNINFSQILEAAMQSLRSSK